MGHRSNRNWCITKNYATRQAARLSIFDAATETLAQLLTASLGVRLSESRNLRGQPQTTQYDGPPLFVGKVTSRRFHR